MGGARVAQGVDRLLRVEACSQCLLSAVGEAGGGARTDCQLLLPGLHQNLHDSWAGQPVGRGGLGGRRRARFDSLASTAYWQVLQVVNALLVF